MTYLEKNIFVFYFFHSSFDYACVLEGEIQRKTIDWQLYIKILLLIFSIYFEFCVWYKINRHDITGNSIESDVKHHNSKLFTVLSTLDFGLIYSVDTNTYSIIFTWRRETSINFFLFFSFFYHNLERVNKFPWCNTV